MSDEPTTTDLHTSIRASRVKVARSRGAASGVLLIVLGAWAALVPFIGPYFNLAFTPKPNDAWHWTTGRGLYEVLPGAVTVFGALLLILSANRVVASFGGWLAAAAGGWLIVAPSLAQPIGVDLGRPDPSSGTSTRALTSLLFFFAIGGAILLFAALALGRLSVHSVRDVRAAERRAEAEAAAEAERARLERRQDEERAERDRADRDRGVGERRVGERREGERWEGERREGDPATAEGPEHGAHRVDQGGAPDPRYAQQPPPPQGADPHYGQQPPPPGTPNR